MVVLPLRNARNAERERMNKYKLALFAVLKNSKIMPVGLKLGKTMKEIDTMTVATMQEIVSKCDFEALQRAYVNGGGEQE